MPKISINKGGTWHTAKKIWVNKGGTWYLAKKMWINKNGTWHLAHTGVSPVSQSYSTSAFTTQNLISWLANGNTQAQGSSIGGWLDSIETGNGAGFWIRWSKDGGGAYMGGGRSFGTWYQMTTNISVLQDSGFAEFAYSHGQYYVSSDGGSTIAVSGTWEIYNNE